VHTDVTCKCKKIKTAKVTTEKPKTDKSRQHKIKFIIMGLMIQRGKELIRINPSNKQKIEYSTSDGRTWHTRYSGSSCGDFNDLIDNGKEILAQTTKGLYYSTSDGRTWHKRS